MTTDTSTRQSASGIARPEIRPTGLLRQHVPTVHVDEAARQLTAPAEGLRDMTRIAAVFEHSEIELDDLGLKRPSLDDVFLHLTGHRAEDITTQTTEEEQAS